MIKNNMSMYDLKEARWYLDQIKETMKIINEEHCCKDYVISSIDSNIENAIICLNMLKRDIRK